MNKPKNKKSGFNKNYKIISISILIVTLLISLVGGSIWSTIFELFRLQYDSLDITFRFIEISLIVGTFSIAVASFVKNNFVVSKGFQIVASLSILSGILLLFGFTSNAVLAKDISNLQEQISDEIQLEKSTELKENLKGKETAKEVTSFLIAWGMNLFATYLIVLIFLAFNLVFSTNSPRNRQD